MPKRLHHFVNSEIYHVFNRGIDRRETFTDNNEFERAVTSMNYYLHKKPVNKLSTYLKSVQQGSRIDNNEGILLVDLICYCLMGNHFHFLVRQNEDGGISKFLSNFQNSYTRYFNTKHERTGPLFSTQFKAVRIENENQLAHISRYIHLNPYTSEVVNSFDQLISYPWSSLEKYLNLNSSTNLKKEIILANFRSVLEYKRFVLNQAHYQKALKRIEHLVLED